MNFNNNLNDLPEDLRRRIYSQLIRKMNILDHKKKYKLSLNLINKKRHYIFKNLSSYNHYYIIQYNINNYNNYMCQIQSDYQIVSLNEYYIYWRDIGFTGLKEEYKPKEKKIDGYYKKSNPSLYDETYYKLKYKKHKNKRYYNKNRNKYCIKDMRK